MSLQARDAMIVKAKDNLAAEASLPGSQARVRQDEARRKQQWWGRGEAGVR